MSRVFLVCLFLALATVVAGDTSAQNATPAVDASLDADRAKSNALTAEQRTQAQNLFKSAFDLFQASKFDAARIGFERGLAIDPANSDANFYLAESLLRLGDKARARSLYSKVIALEPGSPRALEAEAALQNLTTKALTAAQERALKPKDTFKECDECPEMVVVPAGTFIMGSPASDEWRIPDEGPQHRVTFARPFAVGIFSVTFAEWDACVADGGCNGYKPDDNGWGRDRQPVINIGNSNDAKAYVAWLSRKTGKTYRLLSEAEREYVTRAGTTTEFWWGSEISTKLANYNGTYGYRNGPAGEYRVRTMPVDSFSPNPWGLYQLNGNVWEWTEDCWNDNYRGAPTNGSAWTSGDCSRRVLRGGSWVSRPPNLRSASRGKSSSVDKIYDFGFRVARTISP